MKSQVSVEDFLGRDFKFAFAVLDRGNGGNGANKSVGIPIRDIAILKIAGEPAVHTRGPVCSEFHDLRCGSAKACESHDYDCERAIHWSCHSPPQMVWKMLKSFLALLNCRNIPIALKIPCQKIGKGRTDGANLCSRVVTTVITQPPSAWCKRKAAQTS